MEKKEGILDPKKCDASSSHLKMCPLFVGSVHNFGREKMEIIEISDH